MRMSSSLLFKKMDKYSIFFNERSVLFASMYNFAFKISAAINGVCNRVMRGTIGARIISYDSLTQAHPREIDHKKKPGTSLTILQPLSFLGDQPTKFSHKPLSLVSAS